MPSDTTLVFIHIPKVAGSTLKTIILRQYSRNGVFFSLHDRWEEFEKLNYSERARYRAYQGHIDFGLHEKLPVPVSYITLLRDPVDRWISDYYHALRDPAHPRSYLATASNNTACDFFRFRFEEQGLTDAMVRMLSGTYGIDVGYPREPLPREALELAKHNLEKQFTVVGFTDRFDESLLIMRLALGWNNVYYVRRNVSSNRSSSRQLPEHIEDYIRQHSQLDIELYQFAREIFDQRVLALGEGFQCQVRGFQRKNRIYAFIRRGYEKLPLFARTRMRSILANHKL